MPKKIEAKKKIDIEHITELVREIKEREQVEKQLEAEIKAAKEEIKQVMTDNKLEELLADVFTIRYKPVVTSRFDTATFKGKNKEIYDMYLVESETMKLTIT